MKNFKIIFFTNLPSPYMVNFFNQLGNFCELTVVFDRSFAGDRNREWHGNEFINFNPVFINGFKIGNEFSFGFKIFTLLKSLKEYDHHFISNPVSFNVLPVFLYLKKAGIKAIIQSEGGYPGRGGVIKEFIKNKIFSNNSLYMSTNKKADEYFIHYGINPSMILRYPFSSLEEADFRERPLSSGEKTLCKERLGFGSSNIALMVGRFIKSKNFDKIILEWNKTYNPNTLILVGDGPQRSYLETLARNQKENNIIILDFKNKIELFEIYDCSSVLIHPSEFDVWGLVLNEAAARGLPIIVSDKVISAYSLVSEGANGVICQSQDFKKMVQVSKDILMQDCLIYNMGFKSIKLTKLFTIEEMVKRHLEIIKHRDT